jgi:uncharacterized membrane protein
VNAGGAATYSVDVGAVGGFFGDVALSASGLPAGVTASFSPATLAAGGSSTLTISTAPTTPGGTYPVTVQAASGTSTHTVALTLVVAGQDFALAASPADVTVTQGGTATSTISLAGFNGFAGTVSLVASGAPAGTKVKLSRESVAGMGTATLMFAASTATPAGTYPVTVTGVSRNLTRTAEIALTVAPVVPDFKLSAKRSSFAVKHRSAATKTFKLAITPAGGFKGTVTLSADGLPPGTTGTWDASDVSIASGHAATARYRISVPAGTAPGKWTIAVTATSGTVTRTLRLTLVIT